MKTIVSFCIEPGRVLGWKAQDKSQFCKTNPSFALGPSLSQFPPPTGKIESQFESQSFTDYTFPQTLVHSQAIFIAQMPSHLFEAKERELEEFPGDLMFSSESQHLRST